MTKMSLKNLMLLVLSVLLVIGVISAGCAEAETATPPTETPGPIVQEPAPEPETSTLPGGKPETTNQETPAPPDKETDIPVTETPPLIIKDIDPPEAFALIQNNRDNADFVIIDVRTPEEFAEGYIKNAINIDFYAETFRDELDKLDRNQTYLVYCRSGNRSGNTLDVMAELNFREVYNILGGFNRWQAEGYEWETMKAETTERTGATKDALDWKEVKIPAAMN